MEKMRKFKKRYLVWCILIVIFTFFAGWLLSMRILPTSDNMSLSYSQSASNFWKYNLFYVKDNVLYFLDTDLRPNEIKYVKNNVIHTFAKTPDWPEHFIIIDDKTVILQYDFKYAFKDEEHWIRLLNVSDGSMVDLWQGNCVGYHEDRVFFTKDNILYSAEIGENEPNVILSYDELLASDYNGITYRIGDSIYQYLLEQPDAPQLLTTGEIEWPDGGSDLISMPYLYTADYALRISDNELDMYVYKTGEMKRIYEVDDNYIAMAVIARENELYVSRQYMDGKFWTLKDKAINGTYKYDIQENTWTKISNKIYSQIVQFEDKYLYGYESYGIFDRFRRFKVN